MRFCKFCNADFVEDNWFHWVKNGKLKPACKKQREQYRINNRQKIRQKQNQAYTLNKRRLPSKEERLIIAKKFAILKNGECLSLKFLNCKKDLTWKCNIHDFIWTACWNNIKSSGTWCHKCAVEKRELTCMTTYGYKNVTQNPMIRLKAAKTANLITEVPNWQTGVNVQCQGSYEVAVCEYFNNSKIEYLTQIPFKLKDGTIYNVDFYLPTKDLYIEVKGYMYDDAAKKWQLFHAEHKNSELWDTFKLKQMNIL